MIKLGRPNKLTSLAKIFECLFVKLEDVIIDKCQYFTHTWVTLEERLILR